MTRTAVIGLHLIAGRARLSSLRLAAAPFRSISLLSDAPRAVAVCHAYYPSLFEELLSACERAPWVRRIVVTCPFEQQPTLQRLLDSRSAMSSDLLVKFVPSANLGRDVLPFLSLLNDPWLLEADLVLKIHTKRSPHLPFGKGDSWRMSLLERLAPSDLSRRRGLERMLATAAETKRPKALWPIRWTFSVESWGVNRSASMALWRESLLISPGPLIFPAGTMFWCNKAFLAALRRASQTTTEELRSTNACALDGTLAHAVERRIGQLATSLRAAVLTW